MQILQGMIEPYTTTGLISSFKKVDQQASLCKNSTLLIYSQKTKTIKSNIYLVIDDSRGLKIRL